MAYSFENRVKFVVRFLYDTDDNGYLDINDFDCLALRNTLLETRGNFETPAFEINQKVMRNLWNELAEVADFNKNGTVTVSEFKEAIEKTCVGKKYDDFPNAFKAFIRKYFRTIDVNADGLIGLDEYRLDAINRFCYNNIQEIDEAYNKLISDVDKKAGGITLTRYQELYGEFLTNPDEKCKAVYLFGPLQIL